MDQILKDGDYLYRIISHELRATGELHPSGYIENEQLPTECTFLDNSKYKVEYEPLRFGKLEVDDTSDLEPLDIELQAAFTVSNSNILIFGAYMMALYKDCSTGHYIFFDSHSRNEIGLLPTTGVGSSVVLAFENLYIYLKTLSSQLNTAHLTYGIQPIHRSSVSQSSQSDRQSVKSVRQTVSQSIVNQSSQSLPAFELKKNHGHPPDDQVKHVGHPLEM